MDWLPTLNWWQWGLIIVVNSFSGYSVGIGTLYCWHNLKLMRWDYFEGGTNNRRKIFKSFLMWPNATIEKMRHGPLWKPISMKLSPGVYLIIMIILGPLPKIGFTGISYVVSGVMLLSRRAGGWRHFLVPRFITIRR